MQWLAMGMRENPGNHGHSINAPQRAGHRLKKAGAAGRTRGSLSVMAVQSEWRGGCALI